MHQLLELMRNQVAAGLAKKSIDSCSKWAERCRYMSSPFVGPWTFKHHPWLREMHDCDSELVVGQKGAQLGFTEWALNTSLYNIDIKSTDVLYVLPSKRPDASDFSAARFDPALELSPYLMNLFTDVKNVGHKRAGNSNLYIRGSKSRANLKSIPVSVIVLDEVDEMVQENIPLALERTAGQLEKKVLMISTPTIKGTGINKYYSLSSKEHFHFKCPSCSRYTELLFPECIEIPAEDVLDTRIKDSFLKCKECKAKLVHELKHEWLSSGKWVESRTDMDSRGFWISQLYSATVSPVDLARSYLRSLRNPADEQEFYNSKLGLEHAVSGAQLTDEDIEGCVGNYRNGANKPRGIVTMGVDVGKYLHYHVDYWNINSVIGADLHSDSKCKTLEFGKTRNFDDLDKKMAEYSVNAAVIDAQPERRAALQFANRHYGRVKTCFYAQGVTGKEINISKEEEHTVMVDRTSWLDLTLGRYKNKSVTIPFNIDLEYRDQLKALVRVYGKDKDGNTTARYENGDSEDHYAHAKNYSEIALSIRFKFGENHNIQSPI